ncbi:universal stress protein [Colwelliaceae bacterium 6471]
MTTLHIVLSDIELSGAVIAKIALLQQRYSAKLNWYIHHHPRLLDRIYFSGELAFLSENIQKDYQQKIKKLIIKINKSFQHSETSVIREKYWGNILDQQAHKQDPRIIIKPQAGLSSAANQYINNNKSLVYLLNQEQWHSHGKVVGAIDPCHEDDVDNESDTKVLKFMQAWQVYSKDENWRLIHAINIPPLSIEYERQIEKIHKEQVYHFAKRLKCATEHLTFVMGTPEQALVTYARKNKVDMTVLGARAHTTFDKWLNGSTISALIEHQSIDLVLLNN